MSYVKECKRCSGDVYGDGPYQLCDQCLDIVLFGDTKKSDQQLLSFKSLSQSEIDENTKRRQKKYREDTNRYTRIEAIFNVLGAWSKHDPRRPWEKAIALGAKLKDRSEVSLNQISSAFIVYVGREGSERAWNIRDYMVRKKVDVFTYTLPTYVPANNMSKEQTVTFLEEKIKEYSLIVVVLSPSTNYNSGKGSEYVFYEILAAISNNKMIFAIPTSDTKDGIYVFDKQVTYVPTINDLSLFFK